MEIEEVNAIEAEFEQLFKKLKKAAIQQGKIWQDIPKPTWASYAKDSMLKHLPELSKGLNKQGFTCADDILDVHTALSERELGNAHEKGGSFTKAHRVCEARCAKHAQAAKAQHAFLYPSKWQMKNNDWSPAKPYGKYKPLLWKNVARHEPPIQHKPGSPYPTLVAPKVHSSTGCGFFRLRTHVGHLPAKRTYPLGYIAEYTCDSNMAVDGNKYDLPMQVPAKRCNAKKNWAIESTRSVIVDIGKFKTWRSRPTSQCNDAVIKEHPDAEGFTVQYIIDRNVHFRLKYWFWGCSAHFGITKLKPENPIQIPNYGRPEYKLSCQFPVSATHKTSYVVRNFGVLKHSQEKPSTNNNIKHGDTVYIATKGFSGKFNKAVSYSKGKTVLLKQLDWEDGTQKWKVYNLECFAKGKEGDCNDDDVTDEENLIFWNKKTDTVLDCYANGKCFGTKTAELKEPYNFIMKPSNGTGIKTGVKVSLFYNKRYKVACDSDGCETTKSKSYNEFYAIKKEDQSSDAIPQRYRSVTPTEGAARFSWPDVNNTKQCREKCQENSKCATFAFERIEGLCTLFKSGGCKSVDKKHQECNVEVKTRSGHGGVQIFEDFFSPCEIYSYDGISDQDNYKGPGGTQPKQPGFEFGKVTTQQATSGHGGSGHGGGARYDFGKATEHHSVVTITPFMVYNVDAQLTTECILYPVSRIVSREEAEPGSCNAYGSCGFTRACDKFDVYGGWDDHDVYIRKQNCIEGLREIAKKAKEDIVAADKLFVRLQDDVGKFKYELTELNKLLQDNGCYKITACIGKPFQCIKSAWNSLTSIGCEVVKLLIKVGARAIDKILGPALGGVMMIKQVGCALKEKVKRAVASAASVKWKDNSQYLGVSVASANHAASEAGITEEILMDFKELICPLSETDTFKSTLGDIGVIKTMCDKKLSDEQALVEVNAMVEGSSSVLFLLVDIVYFVKDLKCGRFFSAVMRLIKPMILCNLRLGAGDTACQTQGCYW